jgi:hypothetical protein
VCKFLDGTNIHYFTLLQNASSEEQVKTEDPGLFRNYCPSTDTVYPPGDLTVRKRTGTSNRIEIQFRTFNHLLRPDSFVKLFETLGLCLAQGNECLGQI